MNLEKLSQLGSAEWIPLWSWLASTTVKGVMLLALTFGLAWLLRQRSAANRHLVWTGGMAALSFLLLSSWFLPDWSVGAAVMPRWTTFAAPVTGTALFTDADSAGTTTVAGPAIVSLTTSPAGLDPRLVLIIVWALGAALLLLRLLRDLLASRRLVQTASPVPADSSLFATLRSLAEGARVRVPSLRWGRSGMGPFTSGILHPVIVVPADLERLPSAQQRAVLAHELAHVRRHDCATQVLARIVCAVQWMNPLAWWAESRMRVEREITADDSVVGSGAPATDYAELLVGLASSAVDQRGGAITIAMASPSRLGERIGRLLDNRRRRDGLARKSWIASLVVAAAIGAPLGCLRSDDAGTGAPLVYRIDDPRPDEVAKVAQTRLVQAGWSDLDVRQEGRRLTVAIPGGQDSQDTHAVRDRIRTALSSERSLSLAVAFTESPLDEALERAAASLPGLEATTEVWSHQGTELRERYWQGTPSALQALVARAVPSGSQAGAAAEVLLDHKADDRARTLVIDPATRIALRGTRAEVTRDETGKPMLALTFGPDEAGAIERLTSQPMHLGRRLVLLLGPDQVLAAPTLQAPMRGKARLTFGAQDTEAAIVQLADEINGRLRGRLQLATP